VDKEKEKEEKAKAKSKKKAKDGGQIPTSSMVDQASEMPTSSQSGVKKKATLL